MPIDNKLKKWLDNNKMWIKSGSDKEKTHNVMEYGCFLSIRPDLSDTFIGKLAKTLEDGKINFLLEIRTDYFKFMVDVDFKSEFKLSIEKKELLMKTIQGAINEFVGSQLDKNILIVSSCEDEKIIYNNQEMIKVGFHLIWPNLIVGIDEARYLRSVIIQKLDYININFLSFGNWENIIDNSIYDNKHALRMNGSSKNIRCPKCKGKSKAKNECFNCKQSGWFNAGRIYKPYLVLDKKCNKLENILANLNTSMYNNLTSTSIRTNDTKSNIIISKNIPPNWFSEDKYHIHTMRGSKKNKVKIQNDPFSKYDYKQQDEVSQNDIIYTKLITFLNSQLYKISKQFDNIEFDKLKKIKIGAKNKFIYILSTKSHFCLNMNREHSSNHIYFTITDKNHSVCQKCFSPYKNTKGVLCTDFKSKPILLNTKIYNLLFNQTTQTNVENNEYSKKRIARKFSVD